jgi:DNA ligase-1
MEYRVVAEIFSKMEGTTKRLELTDILTSLFKATPPQLLDKVVYLTQGKLHPDYMGVEIGVADRLALRALADFYRIPSKHLEVRLQETGDIGSTASEAADTRRQTTLLTQTLTVERVYDTLDRMARAAGEGTVDVKLTLLGSLLNDATPSEAKYLLRTVTGKLRLGIADYTVLDAASQAFLDSKENRPVLERAYNITSDLGKVVKDAAIGGLPAIKRYRVKVNSPIRPMLAERLSSAEEVLAKLDGRCAAEFKLDGERIQIHKDGQRVELFSRRLEKITPQYPDVAEHVRKNVTSSKSIMEAEVVAMNPDTGEYLPFQELMHRRRKYGVAEATEQYPVSINFFDILYLDNMDLTRETYSERRKLLEETVTTSPEVRIIPAKLVPTAPDVEQFMAEAIEAGCEGIMAKDTNSPYRAGAREFSWIKLKREYRGELTDSLDLTIVGGFHGQGRRAGTYGTYLLACYDNDSQRLQTVCKIGTGFKDSDLQSLKESVDALRLKDKPRELDSKMEADVWFEPRIVLEVIASEVTISPIHTACLNRVRQQAGLALRFPKFTGRLRSDKGPMESTTSNEILNMFNKQLKKSVED